MSRPATNKLWFPLTALLLAATACTTEVVENEPEDPSSGGTGGTTTTTSQGGSGGTGGQAVDVTRNVELSDCGGFEPLSGSGDSGEPEPTPPAYCDAEVLYWHYNGASQELIFNNTRVELNCCGNHSISVGKLGDKITVTETDAPEASGARCDCLCVYDFGVSAGPIAEGVVQVELVRHVTDGGAPFVAWQGSIDLADIAGYEIVDGMPSYFCGEYDAPSAS
ncbi:MAG: hypothetical protein JRI23_34155 [Deltaproteobacteria bacterium]|nr:hypothetical protein [Deltaproteobacteria bacterium]MBW2537341.1 hypothetical protein [Deltaproteobacteria bacterium]